MPGRPFSADHAWDHHGAQEPGCAATASAASTPGTSRHLRVIVMALVLCEQRQRLLRTDGNILVRGGAGSGKTTIALAKACADLDGRLGPLGKALFLSFA